MIDKIPIRHIYNKSVTTIDPERQVDAALSILESTRSSAVVVIDDVSSPIGIITERDIARRAGHWDEIIARTVREVMSSPLVTLEEETDFHDAYLQMTKNGFRHLVVVDEKNALKGILEEGDFLRHLSPEQLLAIKEVHRVMSKEVVTVSPAHTVSQTLAIMSARKISSLVITQDERPIGIFTERDAVHLAREGDKVLSSAIERYMSSPLKTIHQDHSVVDAEHILKDGQIRRLVVVDDEGRLRGILTQHDLVKGISGIYVELLRETIRKQADVLNDSLNRLEEQSVLNNILDSFSDKLIIACDRAGVIQYTNTIHFPCFTKSPEKGESLDERVSCFDPSIAQAILNAEISAISYHQSTVIDDDGVRHIFKTSYAPIYSSIKILQGVMFTAEDITHEHEQHYELQKTKARLEQSEARFRTIFENVKEGIVVVKSDDMSVHMVNDAACAMFGYSKDEIIRLTIADLFSPETAAHGKDGFRGIKSGAISKIKENTCLRKDGSIIYADIAVESIDIDGECHLVGVIHDQTEHVEHQKLLETKNLQLRERERQLLQAQDIAKIGNWSLDVGSMKAYWSEEACRIVGVKDVQGAGPELLSTIVFPEEWPSVEASLMGAIEDGTEHHLAYRVRRPSDGEMRWVDCRAIRIEDEDGRTRSLVGTLQDITERKKQEDEVNRVHAMLDALIGRSSDAIFIKDKEGRYLVGNQALADLVGKSVDELIGQDDYALFPLEHARQYQADDLRIKEAGDPTTYEETVVGVEGVFTFLTTKGPLIIDGKIEGVFGIARDISDLKQSQAALQESEERLRLFFEHAPAALAMFDRDMHYIAASHRWISDLQLQRSDVIGRSHYELFPGLPRHLKEAHSRGLAGETVHKENDQFRLEDGSVKWWDWEVRPWKRVDGSIGGIVIFSEDVTAQQEHLFALKRSEEILSDAQAMGRIGNFELGIKTKKGYWSKELYRILGFRLQETTPSFDDFFERVHPDDRTIITQQIEQARSAGKSNGAEFRYFLPDGEMRHIGVNVKALLDTTGEPVLLRGTAQDITERVQTQERYRTLFERTGTSVGVVEEDGTFSLVNHNFIALAESTEQELIETHFMALVEESQRERLQVYHMARLHGRSVPEHYEFDFISKKGKKGTGLLNAVYLPDTKQTIVSIIDISDRKRAESDLVERESELETIIASIPHMLFVKDAKELRFVRFNTAGERLLGLTKEEVIGKSDHELFTKGQADLFTADDQKVLATKMILDIPEETLETPFGTRILHTKKVPIVGNHGQVKYLLGISEDITEAKEAEIKEKRISEELARAQKVGHIGSWSFHVDDDRTEWSDETYRIFGRERNSVALDQETILTWIHPEDRQNRQLLTQRMLDITPKTQMENMQYRVIRPDGSLRWVDVSFEQECEEEGTIGSYFGTVQDITDRKIAEQALWESEDRYRSFIEQTAEGVYSYESDEVISVDLPIQEQVRRIYRGHIVACNDAMAQMYGLEDANALMGKTLIELHGSDDDPENIAFLTRWIKEDYRISDMISSEIDSEGNKIWFSNSVVGMVEEGKLVRVWGTQTDITQRKMDEIKLKEQEELMIVQSRQAAMGEMINMIAHQWRQPLSVVSMAANNLLLDIELEELTEENIKAQLSIVHGQVQYMSQTIDDFRNFFRRSNMLESISMSSLIDEVLKIIGPALSANAIEVEVDCEPSIAVTTYKSELIQVIINILSNAKDALRTIDQEKRVQIVVRSEGDYLTLSISNNGPGITKKMLNSVFEPYFTTKEKSGGTGLGLYMSKAIIEKHMHGSIKVKNLDQGVEFLMTFAKVLEEGDFHRVDS